MKTSLPAQPVELAFVNSHGDPSVGIPGYSEHIPMWFDPDCLAKEDIAPALEKIREHFRAAYEEMCGEPVTITFDYELPEETSAL